MKQRHCGKLGLCCLRAKQGLKTLTLILKCRALGFFSPDELGSEPSGAQDMGLHWGLWFLRESFENLRWEGKTQTPRWVGQDAMILAKDP